MRGKLLTKYIESTNSMQIYESALIDYLRSDECIDKIRENIKINLVPYILLLCREEYNPIFTESRQGDNVHFSMEKVRNISGEYFPLIIRLLNNYPSLIDYLCSDLEDDLHVSINISENLKILMVKFDIDTAQDYEYEYAAFETEYFEHIKNKVKKEFIDRLEEILLEDIERREHSYILTYLNNLEDDLYKYLEDEYSHFDDSSANYDLYTDIIEHNKDLFDKDKAFLLKDINNYLKLKDEKNGNDLVRF